MFKRNSISILGMVLAFTGFFFSSCDSLLDSTLEQAASPTFSPPGGTYTTDISVALGSSIDDSAIFYTTDGTSPSAQSTVYSEPIAISGDGQVTTIKAITVALDYSISNIAVATYIINHPDLVTITTLAVAGVTVPVRDATPVTTAIDTTQYTGTISWSPGDSPFRASTVYTATITLTPKAGYTLNGVAANGFAVNGATATNAAGSGVITAVFPATQDADALITATPSISPSGGTFTSDQSVTLSSATTGATVYYTTDGSDPTGSSTVYTAAFTVGGAGSHTVKAMATKSGYDNSSVASATFTISYPTVVTPSFSPPAGTYNADKEVSISTSTAGAVIYYTVDGSAPTDASIVYTSPISVSGNGTTKTIRAIAVKSGYITSAEASASYTINYAATSTPVISPVEGDRSGDLTVTITADAGASIRYTTDGSVPGSGSSLYSAPFTISGEGSHTVKAIATKSGAAASSIASQTYTITYPTAVAPVFSPAAGTYTTDQSVSLSSGTDGAVIHYTVNGSTPTAASSIYSTPISVAGDNASKVIKAIAVRSGYKVSATSEAQYEINYPDVATPSFSPAGGTYSADQNVSIATTTSGAIIRYTTNGDEPSTASTQYTGSISIAGDGTIQQIRARAFAAGYSDSEVQTASYTIAYPTVATPTFLVGSSSGGGTDKTVTIYSTAGATIYYTTNGDTPTTSSAVYSGTITLTAEGTHTIKAIAIKAGYKNSGVASESVTIVYPKAVSSLVIGGVTVPVCDATPVTAVTEIAEYRGSVSWSPAASTFAAGTVYTATITLMPKSGYTLSGIAANSFTVSGASSVTNAAGSGVVTAVFPATALIPSTIVFADGSSVSKPVGSGVYTNAVSGDGSGTITYTSGAPATATVNASTGAVTLVAAGTTNITASKAATSTHSAVSASYTLTVTSADYVSSYIGTLKYVPTGRFQRDGTATNITVMESPYRMSATEITRAQFTAVMRVDPSDDSKSSGSSADPVQQISWYDAIAFCNKLSLAEGLTPVYNVEGVNFSTLTYAQIPNDTNGAKTYISYPNTWHTEWFASVDWDANGYRLPTEMEWMWAAMGATCDRSNGYTGNGVNTTGYTKGYAGSSESGSAQVNMGSYVVFDQSKTSVVGSKLPNELGLYDMTGNVWEWVWDAQIAGGIPAGTLYSNTYRGNTTLTGDTNILYRMQRGGSYGYESGEAPLMVKYRPSGRSLWTKAQYTGFRVVRN